MLLANGRFPESVIEALALESKAVPNYGELYQLTYNQQEGQIEPIVDFMKANNLVRGNRIMEIMAGNGFETLLIKRKIRGNKYFCSDILDYFEPIEGIEYAKIDCTDMDYRHFTKDRMGNDFIDPFNMIFIGGANASMCMLTELEQVMKLAMFLQHNVVSGGFAALSYFESADDEDNFNIDYTVTPIEFYSKKLDGQYAHWFGGMRRDTATQLHHYFNMVAVTKDAVLTPKTKYTKVIHGDSPFIARNWQTAIVVEVMKLAGFEYVGAKFEDLNTRFMPFKKTRTIKSLRF
jgi:hypothetical protein